MDLALKKHRSLSDRILGIIEKGILNGSIKPGERLNKTELAKNLGVSKSPVRDALKRLEGDGIVKLEPRIGYFVRNIDRKSVEDFFDVMFILEPTAAAVSLKKRDENVCREIDELLRKMDHCLRKKDYENYLLVNDEFHGLFHELADNEWLHKISQMLWKQAYLFRSFSLYTKDRFSSSIKEHYAIAQAYKEGDRKGLEKAVKNHLAMFKDNILRSDFFKDNFAISVTNKIKR